MLESPVLILGPWLVQNSNCQRRTISDQQGQFLGFAERQWKHLIPWLGWLSQSEVRLFETEDAALLCTAYPRRRRSWEVCDSEDRPIAFCHDRVRGRKGPFDHRYTGMRVEDSQGRVFAWIADSASGGEQTILDPGSAVLGVIQLSDRSAKVEFEAKLSENPFVKMALLVAAVVMER
jgi:hypothetical protein